jgi:hypothetical protein
MKRVALLALVCVASLAATADAQADHWAPGACGLPPALPLHVEYAEGAVSARILYKIFGPARPPLVLATSGRNVPGRLRRLGAHTIFWEMKIQHLLGTTTAPGDPATIDAAADRLYQRAVNATACATPSIALNELNGAWLSTPWSPTNTQYRANTLQLLRRLHSRGAHPYLMVTTSPPPFTATPEAADWWRQAATVSDLVLQVHFDGRFAYRRGPIVGSRLRRMKMRRALDQFTGIGVPPQRLGLLHGFQSGRGFGGREGLPLARWLRVVKWEVLAAKQVIAERQEDGAQIGSDWSWGWGDFPLLSRVDPDKHVTACVYLWARDPRLCDGPRRAAAYGEPFNTSLTEGQIILAPGVHCSVGGDGATIASETVRALADVNPAGRGPIGRPAALGALFSWLIDAGHAPVRAADVAAAERAVIEQRFAGQGADYERALAAARLPLPLARALLADQLRRRRIARKLQAGRTYPSWLSEKEAQALRTTVCLRDELPQLGLGDLTADLPFLRLPAGVGGARPGRTQ